MTLARTVVAGPRASGSDLPVRADAIGQLRLDGRAGWTFESLAPGRGAEPSPGEPAAPAWRLRPGFGGTEAGCLVVGLALALSRTPGADEAGRLLRQRRRLSAGQEVLVLPDVVEACRPLTTLPLALVFTSVEDCGALLAELAATTRWSLTCAVLDRPR